MNASKAKEQCGYTDRPTLPICGRCVNFSSTRELPAWIAQEIGRNGSVWLNNSRFAEVDKVPDAVRVEKNLRCAIHGFAVKKTASCQSFRAREEAPTS